MCSYFFKNLPVVMYRKFRDVPIFKDIPPICPYFLGFRVGKYGIYYSLYFVNERKEKETDGYEHHDDGEDDVK